MIVSTRLSEPAVLEKNNLDAACVRELQSIIKQIKKNGFQKRIICRYKQLIKQCAVINFKIEALSFSQRFKFGNNTAAVRYQVYRPGLEGHGVQIKPCKIKQLVDLCFKPSDIAFKQIKHRMIR